MKIHAYPECDYHTNIDVFLNGKKVTDAMQADEVSGTVVVAYRNVNGKMVGVFEARPNSLIADDLQIIILKGVVEVRVTLPDDCSETVDQVRARINETGVPLTIRKLEEL